MVYGFVGLPGGGKSLTALSDFVLPQLRASRHVFCNISGLSPVMVSGRLSFSKGGGSFTLSHVERYLHRFSMAFDDDDARARKEFWSVRPDGTKYFADAEGLNILLKELMSYNEAVLVLDECHEYLCSENWKLIKPFLKYISMARHYGHDVVLITQSIMDVWEPIRFRIHETHDFVRGRIGIRTHYTERVYHGWNVFGPVGYSRQRVNDKSLYLLYKSHEEGAVERMGYMSIWRNKKFVLFAFLIVFLACFSAYSLRNGLFGSFGKRYSEPSVSEAPPEHSQSSNVIYVKYVVCGLHDCKATRPDGSVVILPLDYNSGKYPLEVRKYVPSNSVYFGAGVPGSVPAGVPNAAR